jgi:hypothetical protein
MLQEKKGMVRRRRLDNVLFISGVLADQKYDFNIKVA